MYRKDYANLIFHPTNEITSKTEKGIHTTYECSTAVAYVECSISYVDNENGIRKDFVPLFGLFNDLAKDDELIVSVKATPYETGKTLKMAFIINGWELIDMKIGYPKDNFNIIFNQKMRDFKFFA